MRTGTLLDNGIYSDKHFLMLSGLMLGGIFGGFVLHPFSMLVQDLEHPVKGMDLSYLMEALNIHHIPMITMYILFGAVAGYGIFILCLRSGMGLDVSDTQAGLIQICSYCKKIRDDEGVEKGAGPWREVDMYFSRNTDLVFTHGICPGCIEKFFEGLEGTPYPKGQSRE